MLLHSGTEHTGIETEVLGHWLVCSLVRSFARTAHSFAFSAHSFASSAALIRLLARSLIHSQTRGKVNDSMTWFCPRVRCLNISERWFWESLGSLNWTRKTEHARTRTIKQRISHYDIAYIQPKTKKILTFDGCIFHLMRILRLNGEIAVNGHH